MFDIRFNISDQSLTSFNSATRKHRGHLTEEGEASYFGSVHTPSTSCSIFSSVRKQTCSTQQKPPSLLLFLSWPALLELCANLLEEAANLKLSSSCLNELHCLNLYLNVYTTRIVTDFITGRLCATESRVVPRTWHQCHLWFCCGVMFLTLFKSSCTQQEVISVPNIFHCSIFSFLVSWVTVVGVRIEKNVTLNDTYHVKFLNLQVV